MGAHLAQLVHDEVAVSLCGDDTVRAFPALVLFGLPFECLHHHHVVDFELLGDVPGLVDVVGFAGCVSGRSDGHGRKNALCNGVDLLRKLFKRHQV